MNLSKVGLIFAVTCLCLACHGRGCGTKEGLRGGDEDVLSGEEWETSGFKGEGEPDRYFDPTRRDFGPEFNSLCETLAKEVPEPGSGCEREGEMICSNEDAIPQISYPGHHAYCKRPKYLLCEAQSDGSLKWMSHECPVIRSLGGTPTYIRTACQENERGVFCCPSDKIHAVDLSKPPPITLVSPLYPCIPEEAGMMRCEEKNSDLIMKCGFGDSIGAAEVWKEDNRTVYDLCLPCRNCLFWWLEDRCEPVSGSICDPSKGEWWYPYGKCIEEESGPRCADKRWEVCSEK